MSKLKIFFSLCALCFLSTSLYFLFAKEKQEDQGSPFSPETVLWGKAQGPLQARIEVKEHYDNIWVLEAQVRAKYEEFDLQWQIPSGAVLIEGEEFESIKKDNATLIRRQITIEVVGRLEKPHLVLVVSKEDQGENFGHSVVLNLAPSEQETAQLEKVRKYMKSRKIRKMIK